jgi:hypothetical protein
MLFLYALPPRAMRGWNWAINYGTPAYWLGLALLSVVLLFALLRAYREWQDIHDVEEPDSPDDLLSSFRAAHALGELDDDEMQRVEQRLSGLTASTGANERARLRAEHQTSDPKRKHEVPDGVSAEDNAASEPCEPEREKE